MMCACNVRLPKAAASLQVPAFSHRRFADVADMLFALQADRMDDWEHK
jgi:hypothetical protein